MKKFFLLILCPLLAQAKVSETSLKKIEQLYLVEMILKIQYTNIEVPCEAWNSNILESLENNLVSKKSFLAKARNESGYDRIAAKIELDVSKNRTETEFNNTVDSKIKSRVEEVLSDCPKAKDTLFQKISKYDFSNTRPSDYCSAANKIVNETCRDHKEEMKKNTNVKIKKSTETSRQ